MAIMPLPPVPDAPGSIGLGAGGGPGAGAGLGPELEGIAAMLDRGPQVKPEDQILMRLRPALGMARQLAEYIQTQPDLAPYIMAFLSMTVGMKKGQKGVPQGSAGLTPSPAVSPPPLPSGPGPTMPGLPRP
jgi:hypothetical protein